VHIQRIERQDSRCDDHDQGANDKHIKTSDEDVQWFKPSMLRLLCFENAMREEEVEDIQNENAGVDEDTRRDGKSGVRLSRGPRNA